MLQANLLKNKRILVLTAMLIIIFILHSSSKYPQKIMTKNYSSITSSLYGYKNYSEFVPGHLPLILSISHGGELFPHDIPDRKINIPGMVKTGDIKTQEIGKLLSKRIMKRLDGKKPYMIINHLGRRKVDINRPLKEGAETNETYIVWNDYHSFISDAIDEVELRFGCGLLIDIHGQKHPENYIELGYVLSSAILSLPTNVLDGKEIASESSIRALFTRKQNMIRFSKLLRGKHTSLGGKLQNLGYDTVPSHAHEFPMPNEKYFKGGYIVNRHGSRQNERVIDAIQIELPKTLRIGDRKLREKAVDDLAEALVWFMQEYYFTEKL